MEEVKKKQVKKKGKLEKSDYLKLWRMRARLASHWMAAHQDQDVRWLWMAG